MKKLTGKEVSCILRKYPIHVLNEKQYSQFTDKDFQTIHDLTHCTCIEDTVDMKQETQEYDLLQHIKFCLECKNESQAIRLIEKYGFQKQETLKDKLESLVVQWHQRQLRYEEVADDNIASEHNNRKFTYKAMATRDCWKELSVMNDYDLYKLLNN